MLEKTLDSPLDSKEIQPVHPKEISPEYSLEGLMLRLKLQYFGHLMRRTGSLEKTVMLGKTEGGKRRGQQRMRLLDGILTRWTWVWVSSGSWWWTGKPGVLQSMGSQSQTRLRDWTELIGPSRKGKIIGIKFRSIVTRGLGWRKETVYKGVWGDFLEHGNTVSIVVVVTW